MDTLDRDSTDILFSSSSSSDLRFVSLFQSFSGSFNNSVAFPSTRRDAVVFRARFSKSDDGLLQRSSRYMGILYLLKFRTILLNLSKETTRRGLISWYINIVIYLFFHFILQAFEKRPIYYIIYRIRISHDVTSPAVVASAVVVLMQQHVTHISKHRFPLARPYIYMCVCVCVYGAYRIKLNPFRGYNEHWEYISP